jgi:hypothetical protein
LSANLLQRLQNGYTPFGVLKVYGLRDSEDEPDSYFGSMSNRARLEELLENGRTTRDVVDRFVNGTPLFRVNIYEAEIIVTIVSD